MGIRKLAEYKIPYLGLKLGNHKFDFELDDKFFEHFDHKEEDLSKFEVFVDVELEKQSTMMNVVVKFAGTVYCPCDRCGDEVALELDGEDLLIVKFGETSFSEQTDDILVLPSSEHELDLAPYIYEFVMVAIPFRRAHEEVEECNPEVIKKLEELAAKEPIKEEPIDPRWSALNKLKND